MQVLAIVRRTVLAACFALTAISISPGQAKASLLFDITAPGIRNQEATVAGSFIEFPGALPDATDITDFYFQALVELVITTSGFTVHFNENNITSASWSVDVINQEIVDLNLMATYFGATFGSIDLLLTAGTTAGLAPNLGRASLTAPSDGYQLAAFDVTFSPVPEPGSLILFLTGLGVIGLFLMGRRRFTA